MKLDSLARKWVPLWHLWDEHSSARSFKLTALRRIMPHLLSSPWTIRVISLQKLSFPSHLFQISTRLACLLLLCSQTGPAHRTLRMIRKMHIKVSQERGLWRESLRIQTSSSCEALSQLHWFFSSGDFWRFPVLDGRTNCCHLPHYAWKWNLALRQQTKQTHPVCTILMAY